MKGWCAVAAMRSAGDRLAEAAEHSVRRFGFPSSANAAGVRVFGQWAGMLYDADDAELRRRAREGLGAVTRLDLLDLLMGLPRRIPVQRGALSARERRLLRQLPAGCVEVESEWVTRHIVAPLTVGLAVVVVSDWRRGLDRASRFTPFCSTILVLPRVRGDRDHMLIEAAFYGVGVAVATSSGPDMVAEPAPFVQQFHKPAAWWFAEEIHGQVQRTDVKVPNRT